MFFKPQISRIDTNFFIFTKKKVKVKVKVNVEKEALTDLTDFWDYYLMGIYRIYGILLRDGGVALVKKIRWLYTI